VRLGRELRMAHELEEPIRDVLQGKVSSGEALIEDRHGFLSGSDPPPRGSQLNELPRASFCVAEPDKLLLVKP
jgi:hypothetical protein